MFSVFPVFLCVCFSCFLNVAQCFCLYGFRVLVWCVVFRVSRVTFQRFPCSVCASFDCLPRLLCVVFTCVVFRVLFSTFYVFRVFRGLLSMFSVFSVFCFPCFPCFPGLFSAFSVFVFRVFPRFHLLFFAFAFCVFPCFPCWFSVVSVFSIVFLGVGLRLHLHRCPLTILWEADGARLWVGCKDAAVSGEALAANFINVRQQCIGGFDLFRKRGVQDLDAFDASTCHEGSCDPQEFVRVCRAISESLYEENQVLSFCWNGSHRSTLVCAGVIVMTCKAGARTRLCLRFRLACAI